MWDVLSSAAHPPATAGGTDCVQVWVLYVWLSLLVSVSVLSETSLCKLCVLCVSVVDEFRGKTTTETQRTQSLHREARCELVNSASAGYCRTRSGSRWAYRRRRCARERWASSLHSRG